MHRINTSGATVGHLFQDTVAPTTQVDASWLNDVQENICVLIEYAGITLVGGTYTQLRDAVTGLISAAVSAAAVPPGTSVNFAGGSCPAGYLTRDGSSLSTTTYAALFAVIGYTYGGAGASFLLPDDRGEFIRCSDMGRGIDAGRVNGSLQGGQNASHSHLSGIQFTTGSTPPAVYATSATDITGTPHQTVHTDANAPDVQAVGGLSGGSEARPRNRAYIPIIKY